MPVFEYIVVPVVLGFTAAAAWGDFRPMLGYMLGLASYTASPHGRIPMRLQIFWLVFGAVSLCAGYLYVLAGGEFHAMEWVEYTEHIPYAAAVLINAVLALALGFLLYELKLWAAGDAKVFALIAFSLPLSVYEENYFSYFPSFVLFFNIFIAMFFILVVEFVVQNGISAFRSRGALFTDKAKTLWQKAGENKIMVLKLLVFFLALFTIVRIMRHFVREGLDQFMEINKTVIYVILFLMFRPLMRLAAKPWAFTVGVLILVGYGVYAFLFDPTGQAKWEFINIGWLAASIIIFRLVYDAYLKATDQLEIPFAELRKGMILGEETAQAFRERKQFFQEKLGEFSPDGLSYEQAGAVVAWYEENEPEGTLFVSATIPFAPALLIGTALTVIFGGLVFVF